MADVAALDDALALADRGWRVHPLHPISADGGCGCGDAECGAVGKHPRLRSWPTAASADPAVITRWWSARPDDGIGVATGPDSGLVVIDLDPRHGGVDSFTRFLEDLDERLETFRVRTGGGGYHLYCRLPEGVEIKNRAGMLPGVDVRGAGGYVVGPGSPHASGGRYVIDRDIDPVPMPPWLVDLCQRRPGKPTAARPAAPALTADDRERKYALGVLDGACRRLADVPAGSRHDALLREAYTVGGYVGAGALSEAVARAALMDAAASWGSLDGGAVRAVDDGLSGGAAAPLRAPALPPPPARLRVVGGSALPPAADGTDDDVPWPDEPAEADGSDEDEPVGSLTYEAIRDYMGRGKRCSPPPADVFLSRAKTTQLPHPSAANVRSVLADDPRLRGSWWFDVVAGRAKWGTDDIADPHYVAVKTWLDAAYSLRVSTSSVAEQIATIAERRPRDTICEYLDGLTWDGSPRADYWLSWIMGAEDTPLVREYSRKWLIGCVARALRPGCKLDTALVLVGNQGIRKSTAMAALVGADWYSDTGMDLESKDALMRFEGSWVIELGEMSGVHRARVDAVKSLLSSQVDVYRRPYARELVRVPRRAVLIGTENRPEFLSDETGSRRWWPVSVTKADLELVHAVRDQLWAEAVTAYRAGERWYLDADAAAAQAEDADRYSSDDPWAVPVLEYVRLRTSVTASDVLDRALKLDAPHQDQRAAKRVGAILRADGWVRGCERDGNQVRRIWRRDGGEQSS